MEHGVWLANVRPTCQIRSVETGSYTDRFSDESIQYATDAYTLSGVWLLHKRTPRKNVSNGVDSLEARENADRKPISLGGSSAWARLELPFGFYASPFFLSFYGVPANPADLKSGQFMSYGTGNNGTTVTLRNTVSGASTLLAFNAAMQSGCAVALVKAAVRGLGVIFVPQQAADPALYRCELVQVMPDWESL